MSVDKFLASAPHSRFITTRRHPNAFASYAVALVFGLLFVTGALHTSAAFTGLSPWWKVTWEAELIVGGLLGILCLVFTPKMSPNWPDLGDLLRIEGVAGVICAAGLGTYATISLDILGIHSYAWALITLLALGHLARGVQALSEAHYVERLGHLVDLVRGVTLPIEGEALGATIQPTEAAQAAPENETTADGE